MDATHDIDCSRESSLGCHRDAHSPLLERLDSIGRSGTVLAVRDDLESRARAGDVLHDSLHRLSPPAREYPVGGPGLRRARVALDADRQVARFDAGAVRRGESSIPINQGALIASSYRS